MLRTVAFAAILLVGAAQITDPEWIAFKSQYKKHYADDADERQRYGLFQDSKQRVARLNELNGKAGKAFGINWMSDRYPQEQHKTGLKRPKDFVPTAPVREYTTSRNAAGIDWQKTVAVTPVKNQGQCGSCWAFSATEAIESQMILKTGKYDFTLSPQQVASCSPNTGTYGCMGCNGGFTEGAYDYVKSAPGLANGFFIPYEQSLTETENTKACPTAKVEAITGELEELQGSYAQISGYKYAVKPCTSGMSCDNQDLKGLANALEETPVSVCVNAGTWNDYTGGVLSNAACGPNGMDYQDHCVMATGFNTTAPTPYWIVRNSWATTWGMEGYVYLEMAKNTCGLADDTTIPEVKVDLTETEAAEAATRREALFQQASEGSTRAVVV